LHKNKDFELNKTKNLNIIPGGFAPLPLTILHLAQWRYAPPRSPSHVNFQYPHRTNSENPPMLPNLMFSGCGWVVCLPTDPIFPCSLMIRDATSGICYPQLVLFKIFMCCANWSQSWPLFNNVKQKKFKNRLFSDLPALFSRYETGTTDIFLLCSMWCCVIYYFYFPGLSEYFEHLAWTTWRKVEFADIQLSAGRI
jgi:hypothetical protein